MYRYAKKALFKAVVSMVKGINPKWIDKGVKYPKIDLHTWIENPSIEKGQGVREISFIVEAYSNVSYAEAVEMADNVAERLCSEYGSLEVEDATIVSILPDGSEEIEEEDDNNVVVYRQLNRLVATIKTK